MSPKKFYAIIILTHIVLTAVAAGLMWVFATETTGLYALLSLLWAAAVTVGQADMTDYERGVKMHRMMHEVRSISRNTECLITPAAITGLLYIALYHTQCPALAVLAAVSAVMLTIFASSMVVVFWDENENENHNE